MTPKNQNAVTEFEKEFVRQWIKNNRNGNLTYLHFKPGTKYETASILASRILNKDRVKIFIEQEQERLRQASTVDLNYLVQALKEEIDNEIIEEQTETDKVARKMSRDEKKKAIQLIAKLTGLDKQQIDITSNGETIQHVPPQIIINVHKKQDDEI